MSHASRRPSGAKTETLSGAAVRIYDEAARDTKASIDRLLIEIRKRPGLHEEAFALAANSLISSLDIQDRAKIRRGADLGAVTVSESPSTVSVVQFTPQSAESRKASDEAFKRFTVRLTGLYTAKFKDGDGNDFMLGMATPEMLRPVINHYQAQGASMVRTARWLEKIAACGKTGQAIHKSVSLADLERLQREANETPV